MIEVRIRHIDEIYGVSLGEFYPDDLASIVESVKCYGTYSQDTNCKFFMAQFIADSTMTTKAYFDIVVESSEEEIE